MQPIHSMFGGILRHPRVSDEEYERHAQNCKTCRPAEVICPRCSGTGILSRRVGLGKFEYPACECRSQSLRRGQEIYSGLGTNPRAQTFANFEQTVETDGAFEAARSFAEKPTSYSILTIRGGVGTGKTHLLQAIGWASLEAGRQPKFVSLARYLERLRSTYADDSAVSFETLYHSLEAAQVLLLDDIGAERMTSWGQEQLYKIVNHRYQEALAMVVSMNLDERQAADHYGERTADRLLDTGSGRVRVVSTGDLSYRSGHETQ